MDDTITPQKGAPIHLNHIISGMHLEKITKIMSYTNIAIPEFNELDFCYHLGWDMSDNTLDEDTEAGGGYDLGLHSARSC